MKNGYQVQSNIRYIINNCLDVFFFIRAQFWIFGCIRIRQNSQWDTLLRCYFTFLVHRLVPTMLLVRMIVEISLLNNPRLIQPYNNDYETLNPILIFLTENWLYSFCDLVLRHFEFICRDIWKFDKMKTSMLKLAYT